MTGSDGHGEAPAAWHEATRAQWLTPRLGDPAAQRRDMIAALRERLAGLGPVLGGAAIEDALGAMAGVPRELFVCPMAADFAYLPGPVDIGMDQIMSHPELVAVMTAAVAVRGGRMLDVGTGSGYQAAVLAQLAVGVTSVEIIAGHADLARWRLERAGMAQVEVIHADATAPGLWAPRSFDGIIIAAGAAQVPPVLLDALVIGGRLVAPLGPSHAEERLVRIERVAGTAFRRTDLMPARFVPLTGIGQRDSGTP